MELVVPDLRSRQVQLRDYDPELDDIRSILHDVCVELKNQKVEFNVINPTEGEWPTDVFSDFKMIVEQLPAFLHFLSSEDLKSFDLGFWEQGIQRILEFRRIGSRLELNCTTFSLTPPVVQTSLEDAGYWLTMTTALWNRFYNSVKALMPSAILHPWWREWVAQLPATSRP